VAKAACYIAMTGMIVEEDKRQESAFDTIPMISKLETIIFLHAWPFRQQPRFRASSPFPITGQVLLSLSTLLSINFLAGLITPLLL